jgi:diguanylate cyclase (GGDEF)-like protein/PAS domain S-box-containing protein
MSFDYASLQRQMFRYAEDLQELMQQQTALQHRNRIMLEALGRGDQSGDLVLGLLTECIDLYVVTDPQGVITWSSPAADKTLCQFGPPLKGQTMVQLAPLQQQTDVQLLLKQLADPGSSGAFLHRQIELCDGPHSATSCAYEVLVTRVQRRERTEIYWLLSDQIRADVNVLNLQTWAPIFGESSEGLVITSPAGRIQAINPAFTRITGYSADEVQGKSTNMLSSGLQEADFYRELWSTLVEQGGWCGEIFNRRKNGQVYFEWLSIKAIKTHSGETLAYVGVFADKSPSENDQKQLTQLAFHDPLTGLPNRRFLENSTTHALAEAKRMGNSLGLLFLDLNHFKLANDKLGHELVDLALQAVSASLQSAVRRGDLVARIGDDEFAVLLPVVDGADVIQSVANYILFLLDAPVHVGEHVFNIQANIGCARYPQDGDDMITLHQCADAAVYAARQFDMQFCFFESNAVASTRQ